MLFPVRCGVAAIGFVLFAGSTVCAAADNAIVAKTAAVAAEHRLASAAGVEILRAGGNAVDAAVAASLATGVVNPSSSGLGGGGFMTVYVAAERRAHVLDYRERAPGAAHRDLYVRDGRADATASKLGGLAVAVPGEPSGLATALKRFGTMTPAEVSAPAIRLAEQGFAVEAHLAARIAGQREHLAEDPTLAAEFLHADGSPYREGETLRRPALARALRAFAEHGAAPFYSGEIGAALVRSANARGGILTADDLAAYATVERAPLVANYRGYTLLAMPPPSSGGGTLAAALAVLESYPIADLGAGSTTYLHLLAETLKAVFSDRAKYYGDPDFVDVPIDRLTSASHAAGIRAGLSAARARPSAEYGAVAADDDAGTTHISVVDGAGNAVACTTSVNTAFGSRVGVEGYGIVLNNTMDDFSIQPGVPNAFGLVGAEANSVAAGKRPLSSMSPTIVLSGERVRLVAGASGGPLIITGTLQAILNVLDFSMSAEAAVAAPRIHHQWLPEKLGIDARLADRVGPALERRGHSLFEMRGGASVQLIDTGRPGGPLHAVSDPHKGGVPAGY